MDDDNTKIFKNHLANLILLSNKLNRTAIFISKEPGASINFICGIVKNGCLLLINPLGVTTHKLCYQPQTELQSENTLQTVWMSSNQLQCQDYEEEGWVSCGPISVEFIIHILQHFSPSDFDTIWDTLETQEPTKDEHSGLIYHGTRIDKVLPQSLIDLQCSNTSESYETQLIRMRQSNYEKLTKLSQMRAQITGKDVEVYLAWLLESALAQELFNHLMTGNKTIIDIDLG